MWGWLSRTNPSHNYLFDRKAAAKQILAQTLAIRSQQLLFANRVVVRCRVLLCDDLPESRLNTSLSQDGNFAASRDFSGLHCDLRSGLGCGGNGFFNIMDKEVRTHYWGLSISQWSSNTQCSAVRQFGSARAPQTLFGRAEGNAMNFGVERNRRLNLRCHYF